MNLTIKPSLFNKYYKLHPQPTSLRNCLEALKRVDIHDKVVLDPFCGTGTVLIASMVCKAKKAIGSDIEDYSICLRADFNNPLLKTYLRTNTEVEIHWKIDALESIQKFEHDVLVTDPPSPVAILGGTQISVKRDLNMHGNEIHKFWQQRLSPQNLMGKRQRTIAYVLKLAKIELGKGRRVIMNLFAKGNFDWKVYFNKYFKLVKLYKNWYEIKVV